MKALYIEFKLLRDQQGVSAVFIAILLVALLGVAALAVDLGYFFLTRNELQNVADAAALAATRRLGEIYQEMPSNLHASYDLANGPDGDDNGLDDLAEMKTLTNEVAEMNKAAAETITVLDDDIEFGQWDFANGILNVTTAQPDAVRVTARRDERANGQITTFFAKIFNVNTMDVTATATAALSGQGQTEEGELILPIGISEFWFENPEWCDDSIKFSPTKDPDACAAWNSYTYDPPNDNTLRNILAENPNYPSPATTAGDTIFNFIGGNLSQQTFTNMLLLYKDKGYDVKKYSKNFEPAATNSDGSPVTGSLLEKDHANKENTEPLIDPKTGDQQTYPDEADTPRVNHVWETSVVVYGWSNCDNPNTAIPIVGYAPVRIETVYDAGNDGKYISGQVICGKISEDDIRGGGAYYGIKGSIPGLVQ